MGGLGDFLLDLLFRLGRWPSGGEDDGRRAPVHAATLVGPFGIVMDEVGVENRLHLGEGFEPGLAAFDAEVLVEQRAVEALDDAV